MNAGRSAQNSTPSVTSNPGHDAAEGTAEPRRFQHILHVIQPEGHGHCTTHRYANERRHRRNAKGARNTSPVTVAR